MECEMGDITDAILNGEQCDTCGEVFDEPAGYPRTCEGCKREAAQRRKKEKK
jgi:hypothetical protein